MGHHSLLDSLGTNRASAACAVLVAAVLIAFQPHLLVILPILAVLSAPLWVPLVIFLIIV